MSNWEIARNTGPIIATAVHAGHRMRPELLERVALTDDERRREEDPLTDMLAGVGDQTFRARTSRFEIDLNRPADEAIYLEPSDAWGLKIWSEKPTEEMVAQSMEMRTAFYNMMRSWIDESITEYGRVLLLDIHSFNHRRDGPDAEPAPLSDNPDIDLGLTTADEDKFGGVVDAFWSGLEGKTGEREIDIRRNVRFVDGGHWPEWVFAEYGESVCTITLEYKKFFMDEWTNRADIATLEDLRTNLSRATDAARRAL